MSRCQLLLFQPAEAHDADAAPELCASSSDVATRAPCMRIASTDGFAADWALKQP